MPRGGMVALGLLLVLAGSAAPARADDDKYAQGVAAYGNKDYETAIAAFREAYAQNPSPEVLFAWAQAERLNGNCPGAILLYRKFLAERPEGVQADAARLPLARCERAVASRPEGTQVADPGAAGEQPASLPAEPHPIEPPPVVVTPPVASAPPDNDVFWKDPLGDALVGGGAASLAVGVVFFLAASSDDDAAAQAATYDEYGTHHDDAGRERTIAAVAFTVGAGLVVAGGLRWWLVGRRHGSERTPAVSIGASPHGFGIFAAGRF